MVITNILTYCSNLKLDLTDMPLFLFNQTLRLLYLEYQTFALEIYGFFSRLLETKGLILDEAVCKARDDKSWQFCQLGLFNPKLWYAWWGMVVKLKGVISSFEQEHGTLVFACTILQNSTLIFSNWGRMIKNNIELFRVFCIQ